MHILEKISLIKTKTGELKMNENYQQRASHPLMDVIINYLIISTFLTFINFINYMFTYFRIP